MLTSTGMISDVANVESKQHCIFVKFSIVSVKVNSLINLMVKTNLVKFEETSSMHLSGMDVNGSEDNKNNGWTDNDDEDGYESDQNHSKNDEGDNRVVLESSLNSVILIIVSGQCNHRRETKKRSCFFDFPLEKAILKSFLTSTALMINYLSSLCWDLMY